MTSDDSRSGTTRIGRRNYLALGAMAAAGLAGCTSGQKTTQNGRGAEVVTTTESSGPKALTRAFYTTLYADNDIDGANAMYHPESPAADLTTETFEPYGGLENIETEIRSLKVVAEGGGEAEVHVDVAYTTPNGTQTMTDYFYLRYQRGDWKINRWVPEAVRESEGTATATDGS